LARLDELVVRRVDRRRLEELRRHLLLLGDLGVSAARLEDLRDQTEELRLRLEELRLRLEEPRRILLMFCLVDFDEVLVLARFADLLFLDRLRLAELRRLSLLLLFLGDFGVLARLADLFLEDRVLRVDRIRLEELRRLLLLLRLGDLGVLARLAALFLDRVRARCEPRIEERDAERADLREEALEFERLFFLGDLGVRARRDRTPDADRDFEEVDGARRLEPLEVPGARRALLLEVLVLLVLLRLGDFGV